MDDLWKQAEQLNSVQPLENEQFHRWYRFVLAYSDKLVTDVITRYDIDKNSVLLDPFCGTGTTLVAAKSLGIRSYGTDSNPAAVLASNVKTTWTVDRAEVAESLRRLRRRFAPYDFVFDPSGRPDKGLIKDLRERLEKSVVQPRVEYFEDSGMLERSWMHEVPILQSFLLMHMIETTESGSKTINLLRLLLTAAVQESVANIAFGPELFVKKAKVSQKKDSFGAFEAKVHEALHDLKNAPKLRARSKAMVADSRELGRVMEPESVSHVITSPPYPTEKDYTRNSRLELVFLGFVRDKSSLQTVKKEMIRSHSKGIYKTDDDSALVAEVGSVQVVAEELRVKALEKTYGFAKLYSKIITEYFGGMRDT